MESPAELHKLAWHMRTDILEMIAKANSGHPGGSLSAIDLITTLYYAILRHDPKNPTWAERDRFILSKGHAAPALYAVLGGPQWSIMGVRLRVDAGLLAIVLISMAVRRPFTLQYAREQVPQELWGSAEFIRTNYVITGVWALAFAVMVIADLILIYMPDLPHRYGIILTVVALYGAIKFTGWYPDRDKTAAAG